MSATPPCRCPPRSRPPSSAARRRPRKGRPRSRGRRAVATPAPLPSLLILERPRPRRPRRPRRRRRSPRRPGRPSSSSTPATSRGGLRYSWHAEQKEQMGIELPPASRWRARHEQRHDVAPLGDRIAIDPQALNAAGDMRFAWHVSSADIAASTRGLRRDGSGLERADGPRGAPVGGGDVTSRGSDPRSDARRGDAATRAGRRDDRAGPADAPRRGGAAAGGARRQRRALAEALVARREGGHAARRTPSRWSSCRATRAPRRPGRPDRLASGAPPPARLPRPLAQSTRCSSRASKMRFDLDPARRADHARGTTSMAVSAPNSRMNMVMRVGVITGSPRDPRQRRIRPGRHADARLPRRPGRDLRLDERRLSRRASPRVASRHPRRGRLRDVAVRHPVRGPALVVWFVRTRRSGRGRAARRRRGRASSSRRSSRRGARAPSSCSACSNVRAGCLRSPPAGPDGSRASRHGRRVPRDRRDRGGHGRAPRTNPRAPLRAAAPPRRAGAETQPPQDGGQVAPHRRRHGALHRRHHGHPGCAPR